MNNRVVFDYQLPAGVTVMYKGKPYTTGNRRITEVELYEDGRFYRTVLIKDVEIPTGSTWSLPDKL